MSVEIDVLICAYNEAENIPRLLESFRRQTVGSELFRIVFVDNASTDDTRRVVEEHSQGLDLKYVYEPNLGKNWACNAGYQLAQTDYVAHIDADAKAAPNWLENILRVIQEEKPDLLGGPYFPYYVTPKPAWFLDRYNSSYQIDKPRYLQEHEYLDGTNMAWRRSVVEQLNRFKVDVGLAGRGLARGDETNLMVRAKREIPSFRAFYHPDIYVYHLTRPQLFSMSYLIRRAFAQGRHDHQVWEEEYQQAGKSQLLLEMARRLNNFCRSLAYGVLRRDRTEFPYLQNYIYERLLGDIGGLGGLYQQYRQLRQRRDIGRRERTGA